MPTFKPFAAIRPKKEIAAEVSCLPYDVMSRREAVKMAEGNDRSFLRVIRSEIDFDESVDEHSEEVYKRAGENLIKMREEGTLVKDKKPMYYVYRLTLDGRSQTGIAGCASIDDYIQEKIKKHELTRFEKELDRVNNSYYCNANTEPVFMTYRAVDEISGITQQWIKEHEPEYDFKSDNRFGHTLWVLDDDATIQRLAGLFEKIDNFYIADGHHRSVSAATVGLRKREQLAGRTTGEEEFNFFMAVCFPDDELYIMDYNRVIKNLNGLSKDEFIARVKENFDVELKGDVPYKPESRHTFGMCLEGTWYKLRAKEGTFDEDNIIASLDCSILQDNLLNPVLDIKDPRADERIDFVGGIRGVEGLAKRVQDGMQLAFAMYPVSMQELVDIADSGEIMPPKSTWFEPKLRSGLFVHELC